MQIRERFLLVVLLATVAVAATMVATSWIMVDRIEQQSRERAIQGVRVLWETLLADRQDVMARALTNFTRDRTALAALADSHAAVLRRKFTTVVRRLDSLGVVDAVFFADPGGREVLSAPRTAESGGKGAAEQALATGRVWRGLLPGGRSGVRIAVAMPLYQGPGKVAGAVVLLRSLRPVLEELAVVSEGEVFLFTPDGRPAFATRRAFVPRLQDVVASFRPADPRRTGPDGRGDRLGQVAMGGGEWRLVSLALTASNGAPLGRLVSADERTAVLQRNAHTRDVAIGVNLAVVLVVLVLLYLYMNRAFNRHLTDLHAVNQLLEARVDERTDALTEANRRLEREIIERREAEAHARNLAYFDPVTTLPNRLRMHEHLEARIAGDESAFGLLLLDLDNFREINDTLGHEIGDRVLQAVAGRLRRLFPGGTFIAHLGGDEFAAVIPRRVGGNEADAADPVQDRSAGEPIGTSRPIGRNADRDIAKRCPKGADHGWSASSDAQRVQAMDGLQQAAAEIAGELAHPVVVEGLNLDIRPSIGIVLYPEHGHDAGTLLQRADVAMYHAKDTHGGHALYSPTYDMTNPQRLSLAGELRSGLVNDELVLYFQPQVDLQRRMLLGFEALVRWHHPQHGLMGPDAFIPLAEQTGLIKPLTQWVLNAGLRQLNTWLRQGLDVRLSVNLSARNLHDRTIAERIEQLLEGWGVEHSRLVLEVTESAILVDPSGAFEALAQLHERGVGLSIDDFGTGYSSLSYLKRLPVTELKVDKSFVMDMLTEENDAVIVRSVIDLAHNLDVPVLAEGIEDDETLDFLEVLGCNAGQGFHVGRPMPAEAVPEWLARAPWRSSRGTDRN